jgi:pimeloyl-ACP methyl ester carboxylesterase
VKLRDVALVIAGAAGAAVLFKMITRPDRVEWESIAELVPHSENSRFALVENIRIHYQEFGKASDPAIVLVHGYTSSVTAWRTSAPLLAEKGFRVIAVDLIGFGYSDKPTWFEYSIDAQARILSRFIESVGLWRAIVAGNSYGGAVAATLALDHAEHVEKLVLVDAVINDDPKNLPILRLAALPGVGEALTPLLVDSKLFWRYRMKNTLAVPNHHLIDDDRVANVRRPIRGADAHHSLLATSRNWNAERITEDAHLIDKPTLIVWGEDDRVIPIRNGYKLHESISGSRFVVIRDCGHVPQEERAEEFVEILAEFCRPETEAAQGPAK